MPVRQKQKRTSAVDTANAHRRDSFQTPAYAVDLLVPFIPITITHIWECAAGYRRISDRLMDWGFNVFSSDIREDLEDVTPYNFLLDLPRTDVYRHPTAIITNPPFSLKQLFFKKCLEYELPFALLIPTDYCGWIIDGIRIHGAEKIIPTRRINYITPSGLSEDNGHTSNFHSMWLTWGFNLGKTETFIELTKEMRKIA
jgi:hypothetical protein